MHSATSESSLFSLYTFTLQAKMGLEPMLDPYLFLIDVSDTNRICEDKHDPCELCV